MLQIRLYKKIKEIVQFKEIKSDKLKIISLEK